MPSTRGPPGSSADATDADTSHRGHPHGPAEAGGERASGSTGHPVDRDYAETPLVVTWEVTQACELSCDHCRASAKPDRDPAELSTAEAATLFEQVADFSPTPFFVLSGGDPMERPDIFELLEAAVDAGLTPSITPATTSRLDPETIDRFAEIGVGRMALSLDGGTARSHDAFRGEDGTFETARRAAAYARSVGLPIQFNTTVTASTVDEMPQIADVVEEYDAAMWEVFFLVPIGRGAALQQLSPERARRLMRWLYRRSQAASYRLITVEAPFYRRVARELQREKGETGRPVGSTGAGNGFVFVSHTGDVYPSGFLPVHAGNVRRESLPAIYREADVMRRLRDRNSLKGPCGSCPAADICGGSRSRAYAVTGDPLRSDPLCPWANSSS